MFRNSNLTLSQAKLSIHLCLLGLLVGLAAGVLLLLFRVVIDLGQGFILDSPDDFSGLPPQWRALLPIAGAAGIAIIAAVTASKYRRLGIAYVIHRIKLHYGRLPLGSAMNQFFSAVIALASGFSVGREGPAVHLGATVATGFARRWKLPDNALSILASCGIAAGISATFNSPLAAVLFVLEVVLREYRIHSFLPILIASVTGSVVTQSVFGNTHLYGHFSMDVIPLAQYPLLLGTGLIIGCVAAGFSHGLLTITETTSRWPLTLKLLLAGACTAAIGLQLPQALGTEHAAVSIALSDNPGLWLLLALLGAKILATWVALGLGIPGGIIGPLYGIGAVLGSLIAWGMTPLFPQMQAYIPLYAVLGMTAMMGVCLHAPMAALLALLELTQDASIILPSLLVTLPAYLLAYSVFGSRSIFLRQLDAMGLDYRVSPTELGLQKTGVMAIADRQFVIGTPKQTDEQLLQLMNDAHQQRLLLRLPQGCELVALHANYDDDTPLTRTEAFGLPMTATLAEVHKLLNRNRQKAVYIYDEHPEHPVGIITWSMLRQEIRARRF
ncbi:MULTISPECIES: chloride channel protein [Ferrimonas]|uniref:chloride channel protein n=1 Tax=Ferrimonas TaxID=44011 RepID=UPI00042A3F5C|nr:MULTISPECIES: chloride channel protein [Ferrimonas]USD36954.1 chloride channel protein [Ferrimonas sp. SCSIO 43195]